MAQSVLGSVSLGYRPLWNRARALAGVQLIVHEDDQGADGRHLLEALAEIWTAESPALVVSARSRALMPGLLAHVDASGPIIEVPAMSLSEPAVRASLQKAKQRGAKLIAAGSPRDAVDAEASRWFVRRSIALDIEDAAVALHAGLQVRQAMAAGRVGNRSDTSPVRPEAMIEGVASRALVEHSLDQQGAWAIAGWPLEDVLHQYEGQPMPMTRRGLVRVMNALDEELSLERIDELLAEEPTLAYRLLVYLNSAGLGLRGGIASLRHGLMMLGFRKVNSWLAEQLPHASEDVNLRPVNATMVMRGQVMAQVMDSGIEDDLRREVQLCGSFSRLDLALNESLRKSLSRIPLSDRIIAATIHGNGPYAPSLEVAIALESDEPSALRKVRKKHEIDAEEINRALLRALAALQV